MIKDVSMLPKKSIKFPRISPQLILIYLLTAVGFFAVGVRQPTLPLNLAEGGFSAQTIGLMTSVFTLGCVLGALFWGWVLDRFPVRWSMLAASLLHGLSVLGYLWASTELEWYFAHTLYGLTWPTMFLLGRWYVGIHSSENNQTSGQAQIAIVIATAMTAGGFLGGWVGNTFGLRASFVLMAIPLLSVGLGILLAFNQLKFDTQAAELKTRSTQFNNSVPSSSIGNPLMIIGGLAALFYMSFSITGIFLPLFANTELGLNPAKVGVLIGFQSLITVVLSLPIGRLADRHGKGRFILLGILAMGIANLVIPISGSYLSLLGSSVLYALGLTIFIPISAAWLSDRVAPAEKGIVMGRLSAIQDTGWMIGPAIGGYLWGSVGPRYAFLLAAAVSGLALLIALAGGWFQRGAGRLS
jgi:MFS transporter, DHA1 family, tetracycline resistance protein